MASPFEYANEKADNTGALQESKPDWQTHNKGEHHCHCGHKSPDKIAQNGLGEGVYQSTFRGSAPADKGPDNYLLLIDNSPSMLNSIIAGESSLLVYHSSKFDAGQAAIQAFLRNLKSGNNVCVEMFGSTALNPHNYDFLSDPKVVQADPAANLFGLGQTKAQECLQAGIVSPLLPMGPGLRGKIMADIKAFPPTSEGATPLAYALDLGRKYLYQNARGPKHVVVMTDGEWTEDCGNPCETVLKPWRKADPACEFTFIIVDPDPQSKIAKTYDCVKQPDIGATVVPVHSEERLTGTMKKIVNHEKLVPDEAEASSSPTVTKKTYAQILPRAQESNGQGYYGGQK